MSTKHNIFAYTEVTPPDGYPAYISINRDDQGRHTVTVRSRGYYGQSVGTIEVSPETLDVLTSAVVDDLYRDEKANPMAIGGYRLEWKTGDYCFYTPEEYATAACRESARVHPLYKTPQPDCPADVCVYFGKYWVKPKHLADENLDKFTPFYLGAILQPKEEAERQISQQSEVRTGWSDGVKSMRLICRENDLVVVDAPPTSRAAEYNGVEGVITAFEDEWIMVNVNGVGRRFRYDELKIL